MIEEQNPWWFHEPDPDWIEFDRLEYRIIPEWINKIPLIPFSLNFILGPRRVGKTLGIKLLIKELTAKNPYQVFYFSCDVLEDHNDLLETLRDYIKLKERKGIKTAYIFLDEITFVNEWWRAIKYIIDRKIVKNDVITLLGSSSMTLSKRFETFGGRRGHGKTIEVMPLSFHDYYLLFYDEFFERKGEEIFDKYLETGGYLSVLNKELKLEELISLIKADLRAVDRSTGTAKDIIGAILDKSPSPVSFHSIAQNVGISTHTAKDYIEIFEGLYIILQLLYQGGDRKIYPRRERKIAIRDPFIARALGLWSRRRIREEVLYEWLVQEHLYRKFGEVYYFKNNYEVDAIADNMKVEVKLTRAHRKYPKEVTVLAKEDIPEFLFNLWLSSISQ